jgi:diguanylate cyclase (GGDEF)-like protein
MKRLFKQLSLTNKLSFLIIAAILFIFTALGIYFDAFLKKSYLDNTTRQMLHGFEKFANDLQSVRKGLVKGVSFIEKDEGLLASVDLINNYQDKNDYNAILLDEEKKLIARDLLNQVKLSFNNDIALYDRNEELSVFVTKESEGYLLQFIAYENGEKRLYERYEHEALYRLVPFHEHGLIHFKHQAFYNKEELIQSPPITYHFFRHTLFVKSHKSLFDPVTGQVTAHLEMTHAFDDAYFEALSKDLGMNMGLSAETPYAPLANELLADTANEKFTISQSDHSYIGVMKVTTRQAPIYITASLEKTVLQNVLTANRQQFAILLVSIAAIILLLLRYLFYKGVARPLDALMQQIAKIEAHDYSSSKPLKTRDELETISRNINQLATTVLERETALEHLSTHDPLTALPNNRLFSQRLQHAMALANRNHTKIALLFLDIDQFKQVNDTLGHNVGDTLLQKASERLSQCLRQSDTLARIGGDEFNILIENVDGIAAIETIVQKLHIDFQRPFQCGEHIINSTVSIGIALYPDDGSDSITLIKHADLAMYNAKDKGRNSYSFFSEELSRLFTERTEMTQALKAALAAGNEFQLLYQPKISLKTFKISGIEALIRWNSPKYGLVMPDRFIPIAEETGLIIPIGEWILEQACRDFMTLQREGYTMDHISINLSGVQLVKSDIISTLKRVIETTGIGAPQIELEITESYIATEAENALHTLRQFRDMQIQLAIDDFGTGYSSLSYLKQLPITRLKIDKSFVDGLPYDTEDVAITKAIIALAKSFNLSITAEGVETSEQVAFLGMGNCDEAQGYLYSRPIDLTTLKTFYQNLEPL